MAYRSGFTLIELLVVLTISTLALTIVAPLMQTQITKSKVSAELIEFKVYMRNSARLAYLRGESVRINLAGRKLVRVQGVNVSEVNYDALFFQPQNILFNANGFTAVKEVSVHTGKKLQSIQLGKTQL
jgi:prepilin-type N-terminal cleavage/methylation domain-containing protein